MIDAQIDAQIDALLAGGAGQTVGHLTLTDTSTRTLTSHPTPEQIRGADAIVGMLDQDQDLRPESVRTLCSRCLRPMHLQPNPDIGALKPICVRCLAKVLARRARLAPPE